MCSLTAHTVISITSREEATLCAAVGEIVDRAGLI